MVKKQRYLLISSVCAFLLLAGLFGAYLYFYRTINISVTDCEPTEGTLLAYIDGEPYYYDPVYLYKLTDGAFPAEPGATDKKKALFYELAYLESSDEGNAVSKKGLAKEIEIRKNNVAEWDSTLEKEEADVAAMKSGDGYSAEDIAQGEQNLAAMEQYVQRYDELWVVCTKGAGITEEKYWRINTPYFKKGILIAAYCSAQVEDYIQKIKNQESEDNMDCFSDEFLLKNFDALVEKYQVEIVDTDLQ